MKKNIIGGKVIFLICSFLILVSFSNSKDKVSVEPINKKHTEQTQILYPKKWHPGHYLEVYHPDRPDEYDAALNSPYIQGIQMRYRWRDLEPAKGHYNFSDIDRNLAEVRAKGKKLFIYLLDQDYWGKNCVPEYMTIDSIYNGGQVRKGTRSNPRLWQPEVMDRYIELYQVIGARYDSDPAFEGIAGNEREIAARDSTYTDRKYADQLMRLQVEIAKAFPRSLVFESLGWTPYIEEIVQNVYNLGLGFTCSDLILPGNFKYKGRVWSHSWIYPFYTSMKGKVPMANSGQVGLQASYGSGHSMDEIFDYAVGNNPGGLHLTHMMWAFPDGPEGFTFDGTILPVIEIRRGYIANSECPENIIKFRGACDCK
jgi:hypothetical protein